MKRTLMRMAGMMIAMSAYVQDDIYGSSIKGVKIMAASKKDAIKKYNHRKK